MPTHPEVLAIEEAHRAAQAKLGIAGAYLAIQSWNANVSATALAASGDAWLSLSLTMIRAIRRKSGRLAIAYYQLVRAIEAGKTLGVPEYSDDPNAVTMGGLRKQYLDILLEISALGDADAKAAANEDGDERWLEDQLRSRQDLPPITPLDPKYSPPDIDDVDLESYIKDLVNVSDYDTDDALIGVDEYDWFEGDEEDAERIREEFAEELREAAIRAQEAKIEALRKQADLTAKQTLDKAQRGHEKTGSAAGGYVDQAGISAGREKIERASRGDARVRMVARGTGPNPCAFCAMLASRGFAFSESTAIERSQAKQQAALDKGASRDEIEKYHPNCHCYPIVRFANIPDATLPELSQFFKENWGPVTSGYGAGTVRDENSKRELSNTQLNKWRRWIYQQTPQNIRRNR